LPLDRAVVGNVDLCTGLFHDFTDHLAAGADDFAILSVGILMVSMRGACSPSSARAVRSLCHFIEDVHAAIARLIERHMHDLFGDAGDLDIHLQRVMPVSVPATLKSMSPR